MIKPSEEAPMAFITIAVGVLAALVFVPTTAFAQTTRVTLATATPGGGFPLFGDAAATVINDTDPTLSVTTANTKGSTENIELLEQGKVDLGLVAGVPAYEALAGIGRPPTTLKIIGAIYSSPGMFVVKGNSPAHTVGDLKGKPIAWGTPSSGLTLMARYAMDGLNLDWNKDFAPRLLEKAGDGPALVLGGEVAALWGGGIGWPGFTQVMRSGGRFIGFTPDDVQRITAKHNFLKPMTMQAGSYEGQTEAVQSVGSWSFILSRPDLTDDLAYRLARALHRGKEALAGRLDQARETTPENTKAAAPEERHIHPGVQAYLREIGL
jgi:TRAP transporter TAXI family solute receptor